VRASKAMADAGAVATGWRLDRGQRQVMVAVAGLLASAGLAT
jgi:hypothetical protein